MPRGSSSVSRYTGTRECSALRNTRINSSIVTVSSTATMSARGTMTSATVSWPKRKMRSKSDTLSAQERIMLLRILRFGQLTVADVMVPRADIVAVDDTVTIEELMRVFRKAEHSRVPVYRETLDDPRGMIHIRDLMSWITEEANGDDGLDLGKVDLKRSVGSINIARELIYVPGSISVLDLLLKMQTSQLHLALVVDEYGGTDGLVSIEDLVEEVVGEIADEHDVEEEPLIRIDPRLLLD